MPEPPAPTAKPIKLTTNCILGGKFFPMFTPLPVERIEDLPEHWKADVATAELEEEEPEGGPARANFRLNEVYQVVNDRLGKRLRSKARREVEAMQAAHEEEDLIEEAANAYELPEDVAADLMEKQQDAVASQRARMAAETNWSEAVSDAAAEANEPPELFVRRGSRHYARATTARLKAGEACYTRNEEGKFEFAGQVNGDLELPDPPTIL